MKGVDSSRDWLRQLPDASHQKDFYELPTTLFRAFTILWPRYYFDCGNNLAESPFSNVGGKGVIGIVCYTSHAIPSRFCKTKWVDVGNIAYFGRVICVVQIERFKGKERYLEVLIEENIFSYRLYCWFEIFVLYFYCYFAQWKNHRSLYRSLGCKDSGAFIQSSRWLNHLTTVLRIHDFLSNRGQDRKEFWFWCTDQDVW